VLRWLALALAASALGCTAQAPLGAAQAAIVGGSADTADPAVVLVNIGNFAICTGEVVSPHVVLTAAHCLTSSQIPATTTWRILIANDFRDAPSSDYVQVKEVHAHPDYRESTIGKADIGVIITREAMSPRPLKLNRTALDASTVGQTVRLVGYGVTTGTDSMGTTAGIKRVTTTQVAEVEPDLIDFGDPQHDTCEGDSGGPALLTMNGEEVIIGITSFGDQSCMRGGSDTRVDLFADSFVQQYIDQADPKPPDPSVIGPDGFPVGAVGATCHTDGDCYSKICGTLTSGGYCTATCDPHQADSCPARTHCGTASGGFYCLRNPSGGCTAAPGVPSSPALALLLTGILVVLIRRAISS
jgi:secreted trypsin-like serine protease